MAELVTQYCISPCHNFVRSYLLQIFHARLTDRLRMSSQPIRAILIDLSGTLHLESTPLPGAIQALRILRASGVPFRFCSNSSKESTSSLCQRLRRIGFDISPETEHKEVWTSIGAVRQILENRGLKRLVLSLFSFCFSYRTSSAISGRTSSYLTLQRKSAVRNRTSQARIKATIP